jgi:tRNA dimethylallyltransferase
MAEPIFLCGPTASGKSALAAALAARLGGEVVNADAYQLYRGLDLLTAAPTEAEREAVPHHLFGVLGPDECCDAMRYRTMALPVIDAIRARGRVPVVTGGSGLYLKFLTHGPSPLPAGDPALRAELEARPLESLVAELRRLDPVEAARTNLRNRRYVSRALEICRLAGRPCSELRDDWRQAAERVERGLAGLVIRRQRDDLHRRIQRRTESMLDAGAIGEVAGLGRASATLEKAIGYREIRDHLEGRIDRRACLERIAAATRQYAKRQETWFRRETWLRPVRWDPGAPAPVEPAVRQLEPAP